MFVETKEHGEVSEAPARIKKLSDAIRIGAALRPQARGLYFTKGASCALGAAYEAVTGKYHEAEESWTGPRMVDWLRDHFNLHTGMWQDISGRNDNGESRESIADWLEGQGY